MGTTHDHHERHRRVLSGLLNGVQWRGAATTPVLHGLGAGRHARDWSGDHLACAAALETLPTLDTAGPGGGAGAGERALRQPRHPVCGVMAAAAAAVAAAAGRGGPDHPGADDSLAACAHASSAAGEEAAAGPRWPALAGAAGRVPRRPVPRRRPRLRAPTAPPPHPTLSLSGALGDREVARVRTPLQEWGRGGRSAHRHRPWRCRREPELWRCADVS